MTRPVPGPARARPRYRSNCLEWAPLPGAVPSARRWTRAVVAEWDLDELCDDTEQVACELIANAVEAHQREHLAAPVRLTLLAGLRTVLVVVRDASTLPPSPAEPEDWEESGRGLRIVAALSASWDVKRCRGGGKVVRAIIRGQRHLREEER